MFLKKITIFLLMFFFWFSSVFADENNFNVTPATINARMPSSDVKVDYNTNNSLQWQSSLNYYQQSVLNTDWPTKEKAEVINQINSEAWPTNEKADMQKILDWKTNTPQQSKSSSKFACEASEDAICSDKFMIPTNDFSPGWEWLNKNSSEKTINWFMTVLIKKLMVALGSLALLIMVVWAWFMIFAMWKDENLNKWKTIFKAWLISLAIALSSYYMVSFLSYILYTTN